MSTPSPEAKQTTEGWPDWIRLEDCRQAIDAATAKLREELDKLKDLREGDNKLIRALAEDAGIKITAPDYMLGLQWEQFHDGVMALAHQQPSATTPDVEKIARKLANDMEAAFHCGPRDVQRFIALILPSLAQAREPLVRDKERLDWLEAHTYHGKPSKSKWGNGKAVHQIEDIWTQPGLNLREAIDAALTGTGNHRKHQRG